MPFSYCWADGKVSFEPTLPSASAYKDSGSYTGAYFSAERPYRFAKNERYVLVRKLGSGNHSNAWLCQDMQYMRHVAVKVVNSDEEPTGISEELCALTKIQRRKAHPSLYHVGMENVITLLGEERIDDHFIFVLEPLTMSLSDLVDYMGKIRGNGRKERLDTKFIKKTALGLLRGLEFLHDELNLIYCGVKPGNILFRLDNMEQATKDEIWDDPGLSMSGEENYQPLGRWLRFSQESRKRFFESATVVMTDFGRSQWDHLKKPYMVYCWTMGIPEILFGEKWGKPVDVWCVGVVTAYMIYGDLVFTSRNRPAQMVEIVRLVSGFSHKYVKENPLSREWLDHKGKLKRNRPTGNEVGAGLRDILDENLDSKDVDPAYKFLRRCLTIRQSIRPPARELVLDEWFTGPGLATATASGRVQAADTAQ